MDKPVEGPGVTFSDSPDYSDHMTRIYIAHDFYFIVHTGCHV